MRFATYRHRGSSEHRVGLAEGDELFGLEPGLSLVDLLGDGPGRLREAGELARRSPSEVAALEEVDLRAPIPSPPSVRDFLAFEQHLENARGAVDPDWYELPVFYFSNPAAICGPYDDVAVAPGSAEWDFELELGAVVGLAGSDLSPEEATDHIAGYFVLCDFSARDIQRREMRLNLGPAKGKDSATSIGPVLVTADELESHRSGHGFSLEMSVSVNGRRYGGGMADSLHWSVEEMVAYASRGTTVRPGDVIGSGTVGTGCILEQVALGHGGEFPWLKAGDVVELEIAELGTLRHRIVAGAELRPLR